MSDKNNYNPEKIWRPKADIGGRWGAINQHTAGARYEEPLPRGEHDLQLYSLATPNGIKVGIMLEELLEAGFENAAYDAHLITIDGKQFSSGFVEINPNSKIPALVDYSVDPALPVFESGAILLYLAEKFDAFIPHDLHHRTRCLSWLFWQMASTPYVGGGFGHFYKYAPEKIEYCIDRFTMEAKRQLDVLNQLLAENQFICGDEYTIADMAIFPWYGGLLLDRVYSAANFLDAKEYPHVLRWAEMIDGRPAVQRGRKVAKRKA